MRSGGPPWWAVLPGGVDDPAAPSGGNRYDRAVLARLAAGHTAGANQPADTNQPADDDQPAAIRGDRAGFGREVREVLVPGAWPTPEPAARAALAGALAGIPDKSDVLLDGLVACGVPDLLEPHAGRLRLVVLVHLPLADETGVTAAEATRLRGLERRALHLAADVIATSRQAARHLRDLHDLGEVHVVPPGVDRAEPAEPTPTGHRLLCVAAVTPRKGQDLLVTALQDHLTDLRWECTFVGAVRRPVPYTSPHLHFTGPRTGAALDASYAHADLLVLPSRAETYGMVVTEALARGLPVVATEVGGVPEALGVAPGGARPGRLVAPDDPVALAVALRAWLTDPDLRARWRSAARARRDTLPDWSDTARRISAILDGVTHGDPG